MVNTVHVHPEDTELLPWDDNCTTCASLQSPAEPGLFTWISAVGSHFLYQHDTELVVADRKPQVNLLPDDWTQRPADVEEPRRKYPHHLDELR